MPRSIKKRIKKEVVEVKVDEDRLEYIRYLGRVAQAQKQPKPMRISPKSSSPRS